MKKAFSIYPIIVMVFTLILPTGCQKEEPAQLPVVSTTPATNISVSAATSGGTINDDGGATIIANGVCWGTNINPSTSDSKTIDGIAVGQFVSNISGLTGGTIYHVRAYATNSVGTAYGADISFSTLGKVPSSITQAASEVSSTGATLTGTVNPNDLPTTVTFEYGTTTNYGSTATAAQNPLTGNSIINVTVIISGLTPGTTYHYRIKTVNSLGTTYGSDVAFSTTGLPPSAITQAACCLSSTGATLNGSVNANGLPTVVTFEFGVTTSYGNTVTATQSPLTGNTSSGVSASLTGLLPATIYHFRIKATNSQGTVYGDEMAFTTSGQSPTVVALPATNITTTSATLNGSVNPHYQSATVVFEYGTSINYGNTVVAFQSPVAGNTTTNVNASISGLTAGVTYHYRVKATNSTGTTYGNDITFTYTIADVEGNIYRTVTIGAQIWMAENLKTTRYNDNISIPNVADQSSWDALTTPGYCWYNNDRSTYGDVYGALYNRYTVSTGKLCPAGWHVPNNADWMVLINYLGGFDPAGAKMKTVGLAHWLSPNTGATNESGFSALPGGLREAGSFFQMGEHANFMSSENIPTWVGAFSAHYNQIRADYGAGSLTVGLSVRCLKDN